MAYTNFFGRLSGHERGPYPYQARLGEGPWPDLVDVPTGLGKTAAVTIAWLWKRLQDDPDTPRRLVYCLPMRVLVEQTLANIEGWLAAAGPMFADGGKEVPRSYALLGGEADDDWIRHPEQAAILVGTQDMLLSRALMRGYGINRFRWPMDYALLHSDALWVFDEVQLMGPALATSAQIEAFRRAPGMSPARPSRSLWLSATLRPDWLRTVDFAAHVDEANALRLSDSERSAGSIRKRTEAPKTVRRAALRLEGAKKADRAAYANRLADAVMESRRGAGPTLVVLNSVDRAQALARSLTERGASDRLLLVHARFRQAERAELNRRIRSVGASDDVIIVATQAIEAGVDLTSRTLFTELAPWSSLVQRFGRCNRAGEYKQADVYWIDLATEAEETLALPYDVEALAQSRAILDGLASAAAADLPPIQEDAPLTHLLRRRDFLELFNTDPDLSGFDIDVAPYIRDQGTPLIQVFWRDFEDDPGRQPQPRREELCPVSLTQIRDHFDREKRWAFRWDHLATDPSRGWQSVSADRIRPGQTLLLRRANGGYSTLLGFVAKHKDAPPALTTPPADRDSPPTTDGDPSTTIGRFVELTAHLDDAVREAADLCAALDEPHNEVIARAMRWHDIGKIHLAFRTALLDHADGATVDRAAFWAKSGGRGRLVYRVPTGNGDEKRPYFRHELASLLAWLEHGERDEAHDLTAYLIAAHHGKVRLGLRALPTEKSPPDDRLHARGVWQGDVLPAFDVVGIHLPKTALRLDVMKLGEGAMGPSWSARTLRLLTEHGPFRLSWLETLVRIADWRASEEEAGGDAARVLEQP